MNFALPTLGIAAGLAAIAGVLYLLQRLRVRHREVSVVTTLFWRQAVEETRARVLVKRFRHLPAYLLALAIAALLWLGFAEPRSATDTGTRYVLLLDGSAGMAWGERFAEARAALLEDAGGLAGGRTQVLFCGGSVRTLLAPGEDLLLLEKRLEGLAPEAAPSSLAAVLRSVAVTVSSPTKVLVYGDGPLELEGPTFDHRLEFVRRDVHPERVGNRGIAALGIAEAASGRWDAVDVYVRLRGDTSAGLEVTLEGTPLAPPPEGSVWRDVPARGQRLAVRVAAQDGLALDDTAAIHLPNRRALRVRVPESLRALFLPVIEADAGLMHEAGGPADVAIDAGSAAPPAGSLSVRTTGPGDAAILIEGPLADPQRALQEAYDELLLAEIDGAALADALGRPVTVTVRDAPERRIVLARALLRPEAGFVGSRAWPVFVSRALRRVAGVRAFDAVAAVGEPLQGIGRWLDGAGVRVDPVGVSFTPPLAGDVTDPDGVVQHVSLLSVGLAASPTADATADAMPALGFSPALLLVLFVFVLLLVEWMLFRTGRMP